VESGKTGDTPANTTAVLEEIRQAAQAVKGDGYEDVLPLHPVEEEQEVVDLADVEQAQHSQASEEAAAVMDQNADRQVHCCFLLSFHTLKVCLPAAGLTFQKY